MPEPFFDLSLFAWMAKQFATGEFSSGCVKWIMLDGCVCMEVFLDLTM